ncbi:MAG: MFS transporter, partial [Candidatus Omnitrophica bacterium]|nr:MFS transporter [Candidatus Omnitrophota bacterium]
IALNSSMVNAARLIGPSIGGILISLYGEGTCFLINALSYIAVLLSLVMMKLPRRERLNRHEASVARQFAEGFAYAFNFIPIRAILMLLSLVSMVAGGLTSLMPVFARDIFHGGARALGLLMAASGMGALAGAIYLAGRRTVLGLGSKIAVMATLFGVAVVIFSRAPVLAVGAPVLLLCGFGMMVQMASSNIMLQTMVEEDKRGRVMSFYTMAFMGLSPFGSLLAGFWAARVGGAFTLLFGGAFSIIGAVMFALYLPKIRTFVRPLYVKKGIIVESVQG